MEPTTNTNQTNADNEKIDEETSRIFENIEGEIKTRFDLLPTELQQVITSSDYQMKLFEVAKKHKLTYEKLGQLEMETTMVLLGMTPPDEFKLDISEQLGLKADELDSVVLDINESVFKPIREKLIQIYSEKEVVDAETYAKEVTSPNTVVETVKNIKVTPVSSPYREPGIEETKTSTTQALNLSQFDAKPGTQSGTIPTSEKNNDDSQKEVIREAPRVDPYREIPGEIKDEKPVPLSKEFLSGLPTLTSKKPENLLSKKEETLISEPVSNTPAPSSTNSLKNISAIKDILSQKISLGDKKEILPEKNEETKDTSTKVTIGEPLKDISKPSEQVSPTDSKIEEVKTVSSQLNLDVLKKVTLPSTDVVKKTETTLEIPKIDTPKEAITLMDDLKKDIDTLNKKISDSPKISIPSSDPKPGVKTIPIDTRISTNLSTGSKPEAIFDDGVKFMEEKSAKPGFFNKLKKIFSPKKPVDVLVTQKIKESAPTTEKVVTMKSTITNIEKK